MKVALRANTGMRLLSGFLTMFMAFLLRDEPFPGWEDKPALLLGLVIGSAGLGSTIGITLGSVLRRISPQVTVVVMLLADTAVTVVVALFYGLPTAVLLGLTAGLTQSWGKLSLDALIQREIPERRRAGTFARVRDPAPALLGRRRLHRHRAAAGPRARPGRGRGDPGRLERVDAQRRAPRGARRSPGVVNARATGLPCASSSSAAPASWAAPWSSPPSPAVTT